jgi:LacI family transcriptional regulator
VTKASTKPITLKELATALELSQSTVSRIVNGAGTTHGIAKETQDRVLHAAALRGYSANAVARSLRQKRTFNIGVMVPEISEGYSTAVLSGIEDELLKNGYFYFVVSHRHRTDLLDGYPRMMLARSVEGIIAVNAPFEEELPVPLVSVSGHKHRAGVINIELDHEQAAYLGLSHLKGWTQAHRLHQGPGLQFGYPPALEGNCGCGKVPEYPHRSATRCSVAGSGAGSGTRNGGHARAA